MLHNIHIRNRILPDGNSHNQKCISVVLEIHKGCIKSCKAFFLPVFILPSYLLPILNSFCWTKNITASSHHNASQNRKIIEPNVYLWVVGFLWSPVSLCEMGANWMFIVKQRQLSGFQPYNTGFFQPECICVTFSPWSIKIVRSKCEWTSYYYAFIMLWLWIVNPHHHISLIAVWAFTKSVSPDKIRGTR